MMKNALYFTLEALFVLKIFKFLSSLFGHVEKRLDWKDEVNFKASQSGKQTVAIHIFKSSHQWCSMKKGVLRNVTEFTGTGVFL